MHLSHAPSRGPRTHLRVAVVAALLLTAGVASPATATTLPPYATLLFAQTQMTAGDGCLPVDTGVARLDTTVAPYLASLGMSGTGSVVTARTLDTTLRCTHSNESMTASWADATALAQTYHWSFVSHTATYPGNLAELTPAKAQAETCGSAQTLDAHGLPGAHGMIAYPGAQSSPASVQAIYGASCFAWGRQYYWTGITTDVATSAATAPYWQTTKGLNGGPCNLSTASCYRIAASGSTRYNLPAPIVTRIKSLQPGQWFTLQAYLLVTGTNPPYSSANTTRWDCTSPDPRLHWTNDNERYCLSDWEQIVAAIAARTDIVVTDPLTVGIAYGRPATYP